HSPSAPFCCRLPALVLHSPFGSGFFQAAPPTSGQRCLGMRKEGAGTTRDSLLIQRDSLLIQAPVVGWPPPAPTTSPVLKPAVAWPDEEDVSGRGDAVAGADAACVHQALESLMLDVEGVFCKHKELWRKPAAAPQGAGCSVRRADSKDVVRHPSCFPDQPTHHHRLPSTLSVPGRLPASPPGRGLPALALAGEAAPRGAAGATAQPDLVRFGSDCLDRASLGSARSSDVLAKMKKVKKARTTFLRQESTGWTHTLRPQRTLSFGLGLRARASQVVQRLPGGVSTHAADATAFISKMVRRPGYEFARVMVMVLDAVLVVSEMQYEGSRAQPPQGGYKILWCSPCFWTYPARCFSPTSS
ncbi:unnamed protein product, partial [Prorocentrum cordatum]